jgi:hypothetical protein
MEYLIISDNLLTGLNKLDLMFDNSDKNTNLFWFSIDLNYLHAGTIPNTLLNLNSLLFLSLSAISLTGTIPNEICNITNLVDLHVEYNSLHGTIPYFSVFLNEFGASNNHFTGTISHLIGSNSLYLSRFEISNNYVHGTIPTNFGNFPFLFLLLLDNNLLSGSLSYYMLNTIRAQQIMLQNNKFTGRLSDMYTNETSQNIVLNIDFSGNRFTGPLPLALFNVEENDFLKSVSFSKNCFDVYLSDIICKSDTLTTFSIDGANTECTSDNNNNKVLNSGLIPSCLFSMKSLQTLHLSGNGFTGV